MDMRRSPHRSRAYLAQIACALCLLCVVGHVAYGQYVARITQVDTKRFPVIRAYIAITDSQGNPIPDELPVTLTLYENGKVVSNNVLSQGADVYCVLVIDVSTSMEQDEKLTKAKTAAASYVRMAPSSYKIGLVAFSD